MKNIVKILGILILLGCWSSCTNDLTSEEPTDVGLVTRSGVLNTTDHYWYRGEKIGINKNESMHFVLFEASDATALSQMPNVQFVEQPQAVVLSSLIRDSSSAMAATSQNELMWAVVATTSAQSALPNVIYEAPFFTTSDEKEVGLSHLFYVKLKQSADLNQLTPLASANHVEILGNNEYMPLWYTLACTNESQGNALEMANAFYETGKFDSCQPDLMCDDDLFAIVNDPLYSSQWHLKNTITPGIDISFEAARGISQGAENIIVAVLDEGIELNHPDLNVYTVSYDTETGTRPSKVYGTHGTNCSGFISAKTNNGIGIASIAPECKLMSVSNTLDGTPDCRQKRADGINFACNYGASVISNSWGSSVRYQIIDDAISNALTKGRSGKGCVVVFASGNDYQSTVAYPGNCNPDIIAVGAIGSSGNRAAFSNYGSALDVVAPGQSVNSTTTGSSYVSGISGTSFACPIVAGVAALVLSVNPVLTQKQVADIIEKTTKKCGNYTYTTQSGYPNGTWNTQMGYGLVDAYSAVLMAQEMNYNKDLYLTDRTFSGKNSFFTYKWIYLNDVTVVQGASLLLEAGNGISISAPFEVDTQATLVIQQTI